MSSGGRDERGRKGGKGRKREARAAGQWSVCERGAPRGVGRAGSGLCRAPGSRLHSRLRGASGKLAADLDVPWQRQGRDNRDSLRANGGTGLALPGCCAFSFFQSPLSCGVAWKDQTVPAAFLPAVTFSAAITEASLAPGGSQRSPHRPAAIATCTSLSALPIEARKIFHLVAMPSF